ncbi:MAG: ATP-binding protein [Planctomycetota bacterium]
MRSLQARIILFSVLLVLAVSAAAAASAVRAIARVTAERLAARSRDVARLVNRVGFPLNERSLLKMKEAVGADLVVGDERGRLLITTLAGPAGAAGGRFLAEGAAAPEGFFRDADFGGIPGRFIFTEPQGPRTFAVVWPLSEAREAERRALRPVLATALVLALAGALAAALLARTLTRPLRDLVTETQRVAKGDFDTPPPVAGPAEVRALAAAFGAMTTGLRRYREDLLRAERLEVLGKMSAGMAHEIRNPLSAIRMMLQVVERDPRAAVFAEELRRMAAEVARLENSVQDVLAFAGPLVLKKSPADLNAIVRETEVFLRPLADHQGVKFRTRLAGRLPKAPLDADRIKQVILNLGQNALQAASGRGEVRLETLAGAGGGVSLTVSDTGNGIPAEARDRVFEPFFTTKGGGTGLGLAVTRRIVEAHGGIIRFETGNAGTMFTVELPING